MRFLFVTLFIMANLITGCKNPLGNSTTADSGFSPGFKEAIQSHPSASKLSIISEPQNAMAGQSLGSIQIQMLDDSNLPITTSGVIVTATIQTNSGGATLSGITSQVTVNGVATFSNLSMNKIGAGYTLVFSAPHLSSSVSQSFIISAGTISAAQSTLAMSTSSVPADGSSSNTITATIRDAYGNPVSGQTVTFASTGSNNTLTQPAQVTNANGQTTGSIASSHGETKTISFANPAALSSISTTATFSSYATQLVFVGQPATSMAGQTLGSVQVEIRDGSNNLVSISGTTVSIAIQNNPGSSTLSGTTSVSTVNGVATFNTLTLNKVGTGYTLNVSSTGLTSAVSQSFNITPAAASATQSTLVLNPTTRPADNINTASITLILKDSYGNVIPGQTIVYSATGSGNTIVQPVSVTDSNGQAVGSIRSSQAGTKAVSVTTPSGISSLTANMVFTATTTFSESFAFNSSNTNYTISTSTLQYNSTNLAHKVLTQDSSNSSSEFGGAISTTNVEWNGSNGIRLNAAGLTAKTGSLESRIMAAVAPTNWTSLEWQSLAPAGKNYPDGAATETGFASGNINMTGNTVLFHFDEASWSTAAGQVTDSSGGGNNGNPNSNVSTGSTAKYGRGANFTTVGQTITVPHNANQDSSTAMSWEAWIYPTNVDGNPRPIVSKRFDSTSSQYAYALFLYQNARMSIDIAGSGTNQRIDTGITFSANTWYHIAATFDGSLSSNRLKFYVNGALASQHQPSATSIPATNSTAIFCVGCMNTNPNTFLGTIDELAVYERALSATEISTRYNRGNRRIKFQARGCANSDCSDGTFVGPDGTAASYFTELLNTGVTNTTSASLPSSFNNKQYFQYKAYFQSDNSVQNPQLQSVSVKPDHYDPGYPMITSISTFSFLTLTGFSATESGTVRYQISYNGSNWYYWNGSNWVSATLGYSHSNTKADVNTNIAAFPTISQGNFYVRAFFDAGISATTPASLTSITVTGSR